jgi:hypothetical protein
MGEREHVAHRLRRACNEQRLSLDTFASRLDGVYLARRESDLNALVEDIPDDHRLSRLLIASTTGFPLWRRVCRKRGVVGVRNRWSCRSARTCLSAVPETVTASCQTQQSRAATRF